MRHGVDYHIIFAGGKYRLQLREILFVRMNGFDIRHGSGEIIDSASGANRDLMPGRNKTPCNFVANPASPAKYDYIHKLLSVRNGEAGRPSLL